jgi:uncharacterized membrane protein YedE/YeeE
MLAPLLVGAIFGAVMRAGVTYRCDCVLDGTSLRHSPLPRALLMAIGVGVILVYAGHLAGLLDFHVKAFYPVGIALGGLIFGTGVALLGFCPGTLTIALAAGGLDAALGVIGGVLAGTLFAGLFPRFRDSLWHGATYPVQRFGPLLGLGAAGEMVLALLVGFLLIGAAFWLARGAAAE